ncbi:Fc receptor-like A [Geothlypis trichas]
MAGDSGMAGKVALLLWAQTLGLAGAQTTQLLVEPPWRPAVLWDRVTLTCQGSGTAGATTWYKDGQRWEQAGRDRLTVTESGTYTCDRPGTRRSPPMTVSNDDLVLQAPARALLEGDKVTLHCRGWWNSTVTWVRFYQDEKDLTGPLNRTELSLSPLQLNHSGSYSCRGLVRSFMSRSAAVTVTVHELSPVPVLEGPPKPTLGSPLTLSCLSTPSPLRPRAPLLHVFYRDGQVLGGPQGSLQLLVPAVGVSHSGNYSCQVRSEGGAVRKSSARLRVTVRIPVSPHALCGLTPSLTSPTTPIPPVPILPHRLPAPPCGRSPVCVPTVPVANATITPGPLSHQVHAGDPVTLRCSVQVGSAPVTFTWLHNGQEVARGPLLELRDIDVGHSGTYQCVATNQLGQDGHRVFRALSPELALEVTPGSPWVTAVAVNVGRTLLFLLLLLAVIGGCHWWHHRATRKLQDRSAPPVSLSGHPRVSPSPAPPRHPQVTNAELSGPHEGQRDPCDYESVL